ncbi:voltage-gated inwardly rectifying potassium channel KCNH2-like [Mustelus asterias]
MYPEFSDHFWSHLEITFNLRDVNMIPASFSSDESDGDFSRLRRRKLSFRRRTERVSDDVRAGSVSQHEKATPGDSVLLGDLLSQRGEKEQRPLSCLSRVNSREQKAPSSIIELSPTEATTGNTDFLIVRGTESETESKRGGIASVSNIFSFWADPHASQYQQVQQSALPTADRTEDPDSPLMRRHWADIDSRLQLLQQQLNRLESRMMTDMSSIMQLLQRQLVLIPPAYSTMSSPPPTSQSDQENCGAFSMEIPVPTSQDSEYPQPERVLLKPCDSLLAGRELGNGVKDYYFVSEECLRIHPQSGESETPSGESARLCTPDRRFSLPGQLRSPDSADGHNAPRYSSIPGS